MSNFMCQLGEELNKSCKWRETDGKHCKSNPHCSFCVEKGTEALEVRRYVRKPRWYERYYKDSVPVKADARSLPPINNIFI